MKYLLVPKPMVELYDFAEGRISNGVSCVLNEKEVVESVNLSGSLVARAEKLSATIYANKELKSIIKKGGYKYE